MSGARPPVVLTGPTGWIGTAFLDALSRRGGAGWTDGVVLFGSTAREIAAPCGSVLSVRALDTICGRDVDGAHVVHLAYLTRDKVATSGPTAFFATNTAIDDAVLAACAAGRPRAVFVASSGAASQAQNGAARELYGVCKLIQEDRFLAFGAGDGVPVLAGRIFNIAGPFINKLDSYAVSNFLRQAFMQGVVRVEARTPVYRSYLHVSDLCDLVLGALNDGLESREAVDLCGPMALEMADVAADALRAAGLAPDRIERGLIDWSRPSRYLGDPTGARTMALRLGMPLRGFAEQVADTATYLRSRAAIAG